MTVLNPVKLVITNYPEGKTEMVSTENNPEDESRGNREMPFSRELFIEQDDFMEEAPKKFFRLTIGGEVRLKGAYIIKGEKVVKDSNGNITEIHCSYDPESRSGSGSEASKRKVKGTLHWVSAQHAIDIEVRQYDRLFNHADPGGQCDDFKNYLNPDSLQVLSHCKAEPAVGQLEVLDTVQFQRQGYFCVDKDSTPNKLVFNRTVTLKDSWAKESTKSE